VIDETTLTVIVSTFIILILVSLIIFLFYVFLKNKSRLEKEKEKLESEVSRSQIEIREEFMRNVGKELHDNIGQVLSTAKLQISMSDSSEEHADSISLIAKSLDDIRNLSKVVDPDAIKGLGLVESCQLEMDRLDRIDAFNAEYNVYGKPFKLDQNVEIIVFRIIQESLNNCLKHADCKEIELSLHFDGSKLMIILRDEGVGFDMDLMNSSSGSGLRNMKQRADMIGASFKIDSHVGEGTTITLTYEKHPNDEQYPNRHSGRPPAIF